jgi:hypothetical protein
LGDKELATQSEIEHFARETYVRSAESLDLCLLDKSAVSMPVLDNEEEECRRDSRDTDSFRSSTTSLNLEVVSWCVRELIKLHSDSRQLPLVTEER